MSSVKLELCELQSSDCIMADVKKIIKLTFQLRSRIQEHEFIQETEKKS